MRQPCVFKNPAGKSTYHKSRMGKLQLDVMAHKWKEAEMARETGGVRPVVGSCKNLEWCNAEAIRAELERMGERKQSFV